MRATLLLLAPSYSLSFPDAIESAEIDILLSTPRGDFGLWGAICGVRGVSAKREKETYQCDDHTKRMGWF